MESAMRLLFVNPVGNLGGAERVLLSVQAALRQTRPEADLQLLALEDGPLLERRSPRRADLVAADAGGLDRTGR